MSDNIYRHAKMKARNVLKNLLSRKTPMLDKILISSIPTVRFTHPVLSPGRVGEWDESDVHSHWIFQDKSGKYWMYYNGRASPGPERGIGLAASKDGINFTKNSKNPLLTPVSGTWESDFLWKCQVLMFGKDDFRMWYGGQSSGIGQVGYATSNDGISWKKYDKNPVITVGNSSEWDSERAKNLRLIYEKDTSEFKGLYYGGQDKKFAIGLTTSPDGINWIKYRNNPVLKPLPDSWEDKHISPFYLMKQDNLYVLFYEGKGKFNSWMIGIAYSRDLINWYRDPRNPIIVPGFQGDFDAAFVSDPSIIVGSDVLKLYYGSFSDSDSGYVGLAYLPLGEKFNDYFRSKGIAWNNYRTEAGDKTDGITCKGYDCEINFISDRGGTLIISIREPNGNWQNYDELTILDNKLRSYSISDAEAIRIQFDRTAVVTAKYVVKRLKLYDDIFTRQEQRG